MYCNIGPRQHH